MKILIVARTDSIHTVRWLSQITDQKWEIHIFPSILGGITHPQLKNVVIHDDFLKFDGRVKLKLSSLPKLIVALPDLIRCRWNYKKFHSLRLTRAIKRIQPDIVHSLEFQTSGYLVLEVKKNFTSGFPKWIATNWGSDIYYFSRFPEHERKIREVLEECDFYSCECNRDVCLAKKHGLKGIALPVFPNTGGFDLDKIQKLNSGKTSLRKKIVLKGYHNWAGRALIALDALEKCKNLLNDYEIVIYSADDEVEERAKLLNDSGALNVKILPKNTPHDDIMALHGSSRISIGLSISDAISTSMLEAMVMGSFPIQSNTACVDEWIKDGKSGFIVPPENPTVIARAIKKALTDNALVDRAAKLNWQTAQKRLGYHLIKKKTIEFYTEVYKSKHNDVKSKRVAKK